ncbi:MAG: hypothetical protein ABEL51_14920 [Salinibacter sp.]
MIVRVVPPLFAVLLGLASVGGCGGGTGLDVAEGRYRLYVKGSLTDTLTGPARVHVRRNARIGIELGTRDGPGLSIEVASPPRAKSGEEGGGIRTRVRTRRYDVVAASLLNGPHADSLSGLLAFLSVNGTEFAATQGHLSVTHVGDGSVGGTFGFKMGERADGRPGVRRVRVTGALWATRP